MAEIFEDVWTAVVEAAEAGSFDPDDPGARAAYPMPSLRATGRLEERQFQVVVLANEWVEARICPSLGGRLVSLSLRGGGDPLAKVGPVRLQPGGPRGLTLPLGLWFQAGASDRLTGLAPVDVSARETDGEASLVCFWLVPGEPLAIQVRWTLSDDDAWLTAETRVWNRSLEPAPCDPVWVLGDAFQPQTGERGTVLSGSRGALALRSPGLALAWLQAERAIVGRRFDSILTLPPRGVDRHTLRIAPLASQAPLALGPAGCVRLGDEGLFLQAFAPLSGTRVQLATRSGETFQADMDLTGPLQTRIPPEALPPGTERVAWLDRKGLPIAQWPPEPAHERPLPPAPFPDPRSAKALSEGDLWLAEADPAFRPAARIRLARRWLGQDDRQAARDNLMDALNWNAEDALAWWESAALERLAGNLDDRPQLENAHFLCPCDPLLRAEAFLSQPAQEGHGPNPLLKPFANDPESAAEAAERLIEAEQWESAAKFLDAALAWCDHGRLRLLLAWCLASRTRMAPEAARILQGAREWGPPFPWRPIERRALAELLASSNFMGIMQTCVPEALLRELSPAPEV